MDEVRQTQEASPDIATLVRNLVRRHRKLVSRICKDELLADEIASDINQLQELILTGAIVYPQAHRSRAKSNDKLRREAEAGVSSIEIRPRADGRTDVRIDQDKELTLSPLLGDLLFVLGIDGGRSDDPLVAWKTLDEIAILLKKKAARRFSRHSVTQNLFRLRQAFGQAGVNPFLIQTNRLRGARVALKRRTEPVIEADSGSEIAV
jgi:hypothetical protein